MPRADPCAVAGEERGQGPELASRPSPTRPPSASVPLFPHPLLPKQHHLFCLPPQQGSRAARSRKVLRSREERPRSYPCSSRPSSKPLHHGTLPLIMPFRMEPTLGHITKPESSPCSCASLRGEACSTQTLDLPRKKWMGGSLLCGPSLGNGWDYGLSTRMPPSPRRATHPQVAERRMWGYEPQEL